MVSQIERELVKAAGVKPEKGEDRQEFLARLIEGVNELGEDDFDGLSEEAQDWANLAVKAAKRKQDISDFENGEDTSPRAKSAASKANKAKVAKKAAVEEDEDEAAADEDEDEKPRGRTAKVVKKAKGTRGASGFSRIHELLAEDADSSKADLIAALKKEGFSISDLTVGTQRSSFRSAAKALQAAGMLKKKIID